LIGSLNTFFLHYPYKLPGPARGLFGPFAGLSEIIPSRFLPCRTKFRLVFSRFFSGLGFICPVSLLLRFPFSRKTPSTCTFLRRRCSLSSSLCFFPLCFYPLSRLRISFFFFRTQTRDLLTDPPLSRLFRMSPPPRFNCPGILAPTLRVFENLPRGGRSSHGVTPPMITSFSISESTLFRLLNRDLLCSCDAGRGGDDSRFLFWI